MGGLADQQAVEKRPSAAFGSFFVTAAYSKYASFLRTSPALHLGIFDQPVRSQFFIGILGER